MKDSRPNDFLNDHILGGRRFRTFQEVGDFNCEWITDQDRKEKRKEDKEKRTDLFLTITALWKLDSRLRGNDA